MPELGKRLSGQFFPNASEQGYYRPYTFTSHLAISRSEFEARHKAISEEKAAFLAGVWPVMAHEYQHGIDHLSTLFGKVWVRKIFNALNVLFWKRQELDRGFHHFIKLHDFQRRAFRADYYTVLDVDFRDPYDGSNPWQIRATVGFEFDFEGQADPNRPIIFAQFFDHAGIRYFSRQPLTATSLLELRSVAVQLHCEVHFQQSLKSKPLDRAFSHNTLDRIYDPGLTLYSVAAHFLAVTSGISETGTVYKRGAGLAHVALNLSEEHFRALKFPAEIEDAAGEAICALRDSVDAGAAFAAMVWAAPHDHTLTDDEWIDTAVERAGLPARDQILDQASAVFLTVDPLDVDGPFSEHYHMLCRHGAICHSELRENRGLFYHPAMISDGLLERLPMAMLGFTDGDLGQFFGLSLLPQSKQEELIAYETHLLRELDDFVRACR